MSIENLGLEFVRSHPRDAVQTLESLDPEHLSEFLARIPAADAAHVLRQLTPQTAAHCLATMDVKAATRAVELLATDFAAMLLRRVEMHARQSILAALPVGSSAMLRSALRYSDVVVGSIMDPDTPVIAADARVGDVRKLLRRQGDRMPHTLFVVDEHKHLTGVADIRQLISARDSDRMDELCRRPPHTLSAWTSLADLRDHATWETHDCLPVIDQKGLFLGSVAKEMLERALRGGQAAEPGETDLAGLALDFAEIFWAVCADILSGADSVKRRPEV